MRSLLTFLCFWLAMARPVPAPVTAETSPAAQTAQVATTQAVITPRASAVQAGTARERLLTVARSQLGTQEATGHNDGPVVKYLTAAGAAKGDPYCAAFVYWVGKEALGAANPFPKSAWSPDMTARATWTKGNGLAPRGGDTFGIYFASKGRVAHTGFIEKVTGSSATTIEANTSAPAVAGSAADREGDGVWRKIRPLSSIYKIQSWFP